MIAILASAVGVVLTALIGITVKNYRNLVTYEITSISHDVMVTGDKIAAASADDFGSTRIVSYFVKLVNRGWKNLHDVKLHWEGDLQPFSIEKTATSISRETIALGKRGQSLEVSIDFLPAKEEVTLSFSTFGRWPSLHKLTGAGGSYKVESIHYYHGQQKALAVLKRLLFGAVLGGAAGLVLASIYGDSHDTKAQSERIESSNTK